MKKLILSIVVICVTTLCFGQTDTIYSNGEKIACSVKEITPDAVKYSYPAEDLINTAHKNTIQKIVFKNGRVQIFAESTSFKKVMDVNDFENIKITQVEADVKGLFKLGDVSSNAKGTSQLSSQDKVKERAYKNFKIKAAMQSANIIYLTKQRSDGNKYATQYSKALPAETSLLGVLYVDQLPDYDLFKKSISDKKTFVAVQKIELYSGSSDMSLSDVQIPFKIIGMTNENGLIILEAELKKTKTTKFRVVSFSDKSYNVFYEDKSTAYNLKIEL
ncbi:hypothetical protein [Flavobacterium sp. 5]|uniref:hypothetical protein n=1 Tax=Flavobacterium sp. 5 TaxID=2035199 RepID=UPI000C2C402A|nr:hypothetical protein [Flavobacterium sp. 5]PKB17214.1 hypothetical protein CLU82_2399 [Flavobacterium sp. 5]